MTNLFGGLFGLVDDQPMHPIVAAYLQELYSEQAYAAHREKVARAEAEKLNQPLDLNKMCEEASARVNSYIDKITYSHLLAMKRDFPKVGTAVFCGDTTTGGITFYGVNGPVTSQELASKDYVKDLVANLLKNRQPTKPPGLFTRIKNTFGYVRS